MSRGVGLTRALLRCGIVAGPVFLGTAAVEGWRRPHYSAVRHPVSSLSLGRRGRVQVANFLAAGGLCGAFAWGLRRARTTGGTRADVALVGLSTAGLVGCALFPADPVNGYPPGTPLAPEQMTPAGLAHLMASSTIMVGVPATTALHAWLAIRAGDRSWAGLSAAATGVSAVAFAGACAGFGQVAGLPAVAGLLQRIAVGAGFAWLGALAVRTVRTVRTDEP